MVITSMHAGWDAAVKACVEGHPHCTFNRGFPPEQGFWVEADECLLKHGWDCAWCPESGTAGFAGRVGDTLLGARYLVPACEKHAVQWEADHPWAARQKGEPWRCPGCGVPAHELPSDHHWDPARQSCGPNLLLWLNAALDHVEKTARSTQQASPSWQNRDRDDELRDDVNAGTVAWIPRPPDREHIALHDPKAALCRVAADRELLANLVGAHEGRQEYITGTFLVKDAMRLLAQGYGWTAPTTRELTA